MNMFQIGGAFCKLSAVHSYLCKILFDVEKNILAA